jgi:arsenate reductase
VVGSRGLALVVGRRTARYDAARIEPVANFAPRGDREAILTITMFGIKNCDTMKKARAWLDEHDVAYAFHDYKTAGIDTAHLNDWIGRVGWEVLLNRAGTTFRKLPEEDRADLDAEKATALMLAQPSMIKRPVLDTGETLLVGFKPEAYEAAGLGRA